MDDGGNYFGYQGQKLELSTGTAINKSLVSDSFHINDQQMQAATRDRLLSRQSYSQNQVVQGQNKSIILNDGKTDRLVIGYAKGGF